MSLVDADERVPAIARHALLQLVQEIRDTERKIEVFDNQILSLARENEVCRRLMTVLTIGLFAATALAATVGNPPSFAAGRHLATWIGLVPKQRSTGGKERLAGISKRGDSYFRKLLIHGARAGVYRVRSHQRPGAWIAGLLAPRHFNIWLIRRHALPGRSRSTDRTTAQRPKLPLHFLLGSSRANIVGVTTGRTGIDQTRWLYRAANARQGNWAPIREPHRGQQRTLHQRPDR
jgi:hypothetical protein